MDINEKFARALELQEQGMDRREIYKILEYQSIDSFTKMMRKFDYKYDKIQKKYICMTSVGQETSVVHKPSKENTIGLQVQKSKQIKSSFIDLKNDVLKENILELAKCHDEIMEILEWYRTYVGQVSYSESQVIEVVQEVIKIDLPKCESTKTSIRVNKDIWQQFSKFAEDHSEFSKGDLLAQALKEYMNKYK